MKNSKARSVKTNMLASFVVFLVALPLCLGIAMASGVPVELGLISGAIGGIVVGILGGSPLQVSGPANGLIVVIGDLIHDHGIEALGISVFLAGLLQFAAGSFRLGQFFRAISPSVVHGLMAGFAVVIFSGQIHIMLASQTKGSALANLAALPELLSNEVSQMLKGELPAAAVAGLLTVAIVIYWGKFASKKLRMLPGALIAVVSVTGLFQILGIEIPTVAIPNDIAAGLFKSFAFPDFSKFDMHMIELALSIGVIASIETLLSAAATDQQHSGPRTMYDRELAAQGIGNMLCGLLGAIPITGVVIRSTANIQAGATSNLSAIFHGVWLILAMLALFPILNLIPIACLAASLIHAVFRLINVNALKALHKQDRSTFPIFLITASVIISVNVLTGVFVGFVLSLVKLLHTFTRLHVDVSTDINAKTTRIALKGVATFLQIPQLARRLDVINSKYEVHIETKQLMFIDQACKDLLHFAQKSHEANGRKFHVDWDGLPSRFEKRADAQ